MYVRSFRVFDIQIAIAVFTYPGVEFWPGSQKIVLIFYEVKPRSKILKAFLLEFPAE